MAAAAHALAKITTILDSASGAAGTRLAIEQALADKHLFFFADLCEHPAVKRVRIPNQRARQWLQISGLQRPRGAND